VPLPNIIYTIEVKNETYDYKNGLKMSLSLEIINNQEKHNLKNYNQSDPEEKPQKKRNIT
jgi:hypothetical protein